MQVRKSHLAPLLFYLFLCLLIATVEMRPGRLYFVLQLLLFRSSVLSLFTYLFVFGFTAWSLHIFLLNKSRILSLAYLFLLTPLLFISLSYRYISGYNYSYADALTALNNLQLRGAALTQYALPIALALLSAAGTALLLWWLSRRIPKIYPPSFGLVLIPAIALGYWYTERSLGVMDDLPVFYRVPISTWLAHQHALPLSERQPVLQAPVSKGVLHVFFIVDESITGSLLSLNGHPLRTTPYLKRMRDSLQNFGVASAYTNQSAGTNIALMSGLQLHELPDLEKQALTQPSIFQYAKKAGYTTYFIDAQIGLGQLQNFMSVQDLSSIDHFIQISEAYPEFPYYLRDFAAAERLLQLAQAEEKVFVYLNKAGAHWPYARTYPPDSLFFRPVLSEQSMRQDSERSKNTYYNSLRWTVDEFWKKLMENLSSADSTYILYTADHGQDLSGDGIQITHARAMGTRAIEADVPLWSLDKTGYTRSFKRPAPHQQSHAQVFPTLLLLFGYDPAFIQHQYGPTLYQAPPPGPRAFLTGDLFGRGPNELILFDRAVHQNR